MITSLQNKRIILAVTGSVACYKAVDLASKLTQAGALIDVILTEAAQQFVTPLTFQAVTGRPAYSSLWETAHDDALPTHIAHVGLGEGADLLVVAPATAHTLAKLAHGLADDLLSVMVLAANCPMMIAPAMDSGMFAHPGVQHNINILIQRGVIMIEPEEGRFASGQVGQGRLPETPTLMGYIRRVIGSDGVLAGHKVVISAGGTREAIDPVRYITNHSSGKQGYALAQAALDAGAQSVVLISTVDTLPIPIGAELIEVNSAHSMLGAVQEHIADADVLIMAAAVADFTPTTVANQKIKKKDHDDEGLTLSLGRTKDILMEVKAQREQTGFPRIVVGFAAESQNLLDNARAKLVRKGVDLLIANDITTNDAGFKAETNRVIMLTLDGQAQPLGPHTKTHISEAIIDQIGTIL